MKNQLLIAEPLEQHKWCLCKLYNNDCIKCVWMGFLLPGDTVSQAIGGQFTLIFSYTNV